MKRLYARLVLSLFALLMGVAQAAEEAGSCMMEHGMMMGGGMLAVYLVFGLLILIALVLVILALIKYLRSGK
ncbi:MAG: hypothetical protein ACRERX_07845 [Pseudomonas sp.]